MLLILKDAFRWPYILNSSCRPVGSCVQSVGKVYISSTESSACVAILPLELFLGWEHLLVIVNVFTDLLEIKVSFVILMIKSLAMAI